MARSISRPSQTYRPGTYGPFPLSGLTSADTSALQWSATVGADWPSDPSVRLFSVTLAWSTGHAATWEIYGGAVDRDGIPLFAHTETVSVPHADDGAGGVRRGNIVGGALTVQVYVPLTSAISAQALA